MEWLEKLIDTSLTHMAATNPDAMLVTKHYPEMLESDIPVRKGWYRWKPIKSTITDDAINLFENKVGHPLPLSYRAYLKYKHFYGLKLRDKAVQLPHHLPDLLQRLDNYMFNELNPELTIRKNYICFADFRDTGLLCFNANISAPDNEYPVVHIDLERLDLVSPYADNFRKLMEANEEGTNRLTSNKGMAQTEKDLPVAARMFRFFFPGGK